MPKAPRDDLQTLQAQYPFAVVLEGLGRQIVLTPWRELRDFGDMVTDQTTIRQLLASAGRDAAVMAGLRRMAVEAGQFLAGINRLDDGRILDSVARAVAAGQIYALEARPKDRLATASAARISYDAVIHGFKREADPYQGGPDEELFDFLIEELPYLWCEAYDAMPGDRSDIVQVSDAGYVYLFDLATDRVVTAFGVSRYNPEDREGIKKRMDGFLGKVKSKRALKKIAEKKPTEVGEHRKEQAQLGWRDRFFRNYGHLYDRGHFMSHHQGGGLDINLFPQRADVNQGHTELGDLYRNMEKTCVAERVFCFSRPIYDDDSWVPASLEYGICRHRNAAWWVQVFPNK